jgi:formamidopyrimidine-DNA glycosylase
MPEGPEVRVIADYLTRYIGGLVTGVYVDEKSKYRGLLPNLDKLKFPLSIHDINTHGKIIIFQFTTGVHFTSQLGMTGRWFLEKKNHSNLWMNIKTPEDIDITLYFDDSRHFGLFDIHLDILSFSKKIIGSTGIDFLKVAMKVYSNNITYDEKLEIYKTNLQKWTISLRKTKRKIGEVLSDQKIFSGVGNYLRAEIMYYAKVHPERKCCDISSKVNEDIFKETLRIIYESYINKGLTIRDYCDPGGNKGTFQTVVYGKTEDPHGNPVKTMKMGSQLIHWVPIVQTL